LPDASLSSLRPTGSAPAWERDFLDIVSLSYLMRNLWPAVESLGVSLQTTCAFDADAVQERAKEDLGIPEGLQVAFATRSGHPLSDEDTATRVPGPGDPCAPRPIQRGRP